ncbi:hypothetical protein L6452_00804 [Arctium lappa]|uniref:Uncharacterized protein n=1 Tax=Arctium lappa TaxID=4217 RepID=A0ACB9FEI2_ARCLA|nr:hypothetical protein L6452_00804 [Arctium lappa]
MFDSSATEDQAVMNSRFGSFNKQRSQSFIDRGARANMNLQSINQSSTYSKWGSPDGNLERMVAGDGDLNLFLVSEMVVGDGDLDLFLMLGGLIWIV